MNELTQQIRTFVVDHFLMGQGDPLTNDASFLEHGVVDSTGVLELVAHLEATYGFKVADEELTPDNLDSIDTIAAFVQRRRTPAMSPNPLA